MSGGRIALIVVGCLVGLLGLALVVGGAALLWANQALRDDDGYFTSDTERFQTPLRAISRRNPTSAKSGGTTAGRTCGSAPSGPEARGFRHRPSGRRQEYLAGGPHAVITDLASTPRPPYEPRRAAPDPPPGPRLLGGAGHRAGEQTMTCVDRGRRLQIVAMNADGLAVVLEASLGVKISYVLAWPSAVLVSVPAARGGARWPSSARGPRGPPPDAAPAGVAGVAEDGRRSPRGRAAAPGEPRRPIRWTSPGARRGSADGSAGQCAGVPHSSCGLPSRIAFFAVPSWPSRDSCSTALPAHPVRVQRGAALVMVRRLLPTADRTIAPAVHARAHGPTAGSSAYPGTVARFGVVNGAAPRPSTSWSPSARQLGLGLGVGGSGGGWTVVVGRWTRAARGDGIPVLSRDRPAVHRSLHARVVRPRVALNRYVSACRSRPSWRRVPASAWTAERRKRRKPQRVDDHEEDRQGIADRRPTGLGSLGPPRRGPRCRRRPKAGASIVSSVRRECRGRGSAAQVARRVESEAR